MTEHQYICCKCKRLVEVPSMAVLTPLQREQLKQQRCAECVEVRTDKPGRF